jgi:hypothetical protein
MPALVGSAAALAALAYSLASVAELHAQLHPAGTCGLKLLYAALSNYAYSLASVAELHAQLHPAGICGLKLLVHEELLVHEA